MRSIDLTNHKKEHRVYFYAEKKKTFHRGTKKKLITKFLASQSNTRSEKWKNKQRRAASAAFVVKLYLNTYFSASIFYSVGRKRVPLVFVAAQDEVHSHGGNYKSERFDVWWL